jgi:NADPH-dependent 2,4-dienoyl-CoA reductase/sulfur reductase-like enzyme
MLFYTLSSWLFASAVVSALVQPRQAPNSVVQDFIDKVRNLIPDSLGGLAPILGTSQAYEYVVVGAGTAGATLAVRLAQSGARVALVEAGALPRLYLL